MAKKIENEGAKPEYKTGFFKKHQNNTCKSHWFFYCRS
jgi:hypothetical protein